ncbi:MAG: hypothetical protein P8N02_00235, partial [Actinomycetota bacterium]|nr:hypothetical protein [Actinomycetota bacterium]
IFNPLPSDAVIDMSFATEAETGAYIAVDLEGVVVPPRVAVRVNIGEHVRRRDVVATTLEARAGRVVVDQFQTYDGSAGRTGFSAALATSVLAERWLLPSGRVDANSRLEVRVMNPSDEVAEVDLAGASADAGGDPIAVTVGPREVVSVHVQPFLDTAPAVPTLEVVSGGDFGVVVESANGVGLVVGVEIGAGSAAAPADDVAVPRSGDSDDRDAAESEDDEVAAEPPEDAPEEVPARVGDTRRSAGAGITLLPAMPMPASRWLLVVPGGDSVVSRLVVQSPTAEPRMVQIHEVGGALRSEFELSGAQVEVVEVAAGSSLVVSADGRIAVSLLQELIDGLGLVGVLPIEF